MGRRSAAVTTGENIAKLERMARPQIERGHNLRGITGVALSFSCPCIPPANANRSGQIRCPTRFFACARYAFAPPQTRGIYLRSHPSRVDSGSRIWLPVNLFRVAIREYVT